MRYLILILLFLIPSMANAVTGQAHREDWSLGQPAIVADATTDCNDTATARFDWSGGQPTVVIDATATCTTVAPPVTGTTQDVFWFE
jgi:hypothetical protein